MPHILHIVALRFKPHMDDEMIAAHFRDDVALMRRMPELVVSATYAKNISLASRADVNGGCQWVVMAKLVSDDPAVLEAYLAHPEHKDVGRIQAPLLDGRFVVDVVVE
jgi:hypothetical protein